MIGQVPKYEVCDNRVARREGGLVEAYGHLESIHWLSPVAFRVFFSRLGFFSVSGLFDNFRIHDVPDSWNGQDEIASLGQEKVVCKRGAWFDCLQLAVNFDGHGDKGVGV